MKRKFKLDRDFVIEFSKGNKKKDATTKEA